MSAVVLNASKILRHRPDDLFGLVSEVRAYPSFIPWITSLAVHHEKHDGATWSGLAEAVVGWKHVRERFSTFVHADRAAREVRVKLARGPFKRLDNVWRFSEAEGGARVDFHVAFEFKNPILQTLAAANTRTAADKIMKAFEKEADRRFKEAAAQS